MDVITDCLPKFGFKTAKLKLKFRSLGIDVPMPRSVIIPLNGSQMVPLFTGYDSPAVIPVSKTAEGSIESVWVETSPVTVIEMLQLERSGTFAPKVIEIVF